VLSAKDDAGEPLLAVVVTIDGKPLTSDLDGRAIEVDPGKHTFAFKRRDGANVSVVVPVIEGLKAQQVTGVFAKAPTAAIQTTAPAVAPPPPVPALPAESSTRPVTPMPSPSPWPTVGLVTAAVGVVGLVVGTVFALDAASKKSPAGCDASGACSTPTGANMLRSAGNSADLATGFFVAGGVLAAGGGLIWAVGPRTTVQAAPTVGTSSMGVALRGTWQ
jgi:hypothetical protein